MREKESEGEVRTSLPLRSFLLFVKLFVVSLFRLSLFFFRVVTVNELLREIGWEE